MTGGEREGQVWPQRGSEAARSDNITRNQTLHQGQDFTSTEASLPSVPKTSFFSEAPKSKAMIKEPENVKVMLLNRQTSGSQMT